MKFKLITFLTVFFFSINASATGDVILDFGDKASIGGPSTKDKELSGIDYSDLFDKAEGYFRAAQSWKTLKCTPISGFLCTKWSCKKRSTQNYFILDKKKQKVKICHGEECETFKANFEQAGVYYNIQSEGAIGILVRVLGNNRYKAITTFGLDAHISNGNCSEHVK